ncbi:MAG: GNAT family N-acetyltransferase, partial [Rickettsiales bacterium]|nr:GNAT family N-acetyltransferase [Rickettsiales bacterium]
YLVAVDNSDKIIGYIAGGKPRSAALSDKIDMEIGILYCAPEWLKNGGKGAGKALFTNLMQEFVKFSAKTCGVGCLSDNKNALGFYQYMGGEIINEVPWWKFPELKETFLRFNL